MKRKPLHFMVWLILLTLSDGLHCAWKGKTVRILVVLDDFEPGLAEEFRTATSMKSLKTLYDTSEDCVKNIDFEFLTLKGSSTEITTIKEIYQLFNQHSFCIIILASNNRQSGYVLEYAKLKHIPVVAIMSEKAETKSSLPKTLQGLPVVHLNSQASTVDKRASIAPILKKLSWKKIILIHDNSIQNMQVATLFERSLAINNILLLNSTLVTADTNIDVLATQLNGLKNSGSTFVVLTSNPAILDMIFKVSYWLDMLNPAFMWVLFTNLGNSYVPVDNTPNELLVVNPIGQEWKSRDLISDAVFLVTKGLDSISKAQNQKMCLCRCGCKPFTRHLYRCILQVQFQGRTGLVKFDDDGQRRYGTFDISVITQQEGEKYRELIGDYDGKRVNIMTQQPLTRLRALINEYPPNIISIPKPANKPCPSSAHICKKPVALPDGTKTFKELCCYGFAIDVLNLIKGEIGFEPELVFSEDGQYGVYNTINDSWNGIVSELLENKGDITLDLYVSARRSKVLDFTEPYAPSGIRLLVKEYSGKGTNIYWLSYLRPFTSTVWFTLLGSVGVMIVFLWIVEKFAPNRLPRKKWEEEQCDDDDDENDQEQFISQFSMLEKPQSRFNFYENQFEIQIPGGEEEELDAPETPPRLIYGSFGLDNAVCFTLALTFGRPADEAKPMLNGARLASVAFGVAMLMVVSSYSANLAAFLIVDDKYTSVKDIYDQKIAHPPSGFKYGTIEGSYMADFFANSENAYMKSMWFNMKRNNVKTVIEGVGKVRSGELDVLIADQISLQYESLNDPSCQLKVVGEPFAMSGAAIALKKGSPWFAPFKDVLQKLKSKGLTDFIQKFWISKYKCVNEKPPSQLKIRDLSGLFLQLAIAVVACFAGTTLHHVVRLLAYKYKYQNNQTDGDIIMNTRSTENNKNRISRRVESKRNQETKV